MDRAMAKRATPIERDERRRKVEYLLIAGTTTNQIAAAVGVNRKTVLLDTRAIRAEWARARVEAYDRYAAEELVRLTKLQEAVWRDAMAGDIKAVGMALRISDQRCRLLGLYAPTKLNVSDERMQSKEAFDHEVQELLARLNAADLAARQAEADALLAGDENRREGLDEDGPRPG
jgi:hypothetical protein